MGSAARMNVEPAGRAVLIASSNDIFREKVEARLLEASWDVEQATGGADALAKLDAGRHSALLVDTWLADLDVPELVRMARHRCPQVDVFTLDSVSGRTDVAESGRLSRGIVRLLHDLQSLRDRRPAEGAIPGLAADENLPACDAPLAGMVGSGEEIRRVYRLARLVAPRKTTVLITGESGTGKELVARAVHDLSPRASRPFVVVNCAAIPEALLEAELFGHVRGAFTGAVQARLGQAQAAHGGTLFLDEIGEMPPALQVKLLRFLQEGEVQRLGSNDIFRADVRVVAATNANLERRVARGTFRRDLYYRLAVFPVNLPPLRERTDDIEALAEHFLERLCGEAGVGCRELAPGALARLRGFAWPGNVRELEHVIERAFILSGGRTPLLPEDFPPPGEVQ